MHEQMQTSRDTMCDLSRRRFMATTLAGTGVLAAGPGWLGAAQRKKAAGKGSATDIVTLGTTGIKATRLAHGTGWNGGARSSAHTRLGEKAFTELLRHSLDQGIMYVDTADLYGAHPYIATALKGVPREKYILSTKIWPRKEYWNSPSGGAQVEVDRFRKELKTDVLDVCLIHCMTDAQWPQTYERIRDELSELKAKGAVRAVGVSCHEFEAVKVAAEHPWVDVFIARINNVGKGAAMDVAPEVKAPVLTRARANGKVVIGMKVFGAGALTKPEQMDASLSYVLGNGLVDVITIGMMTTKQVNDTIRRVDRALKA